MADTDLAGYSLTELLDAARHVDRDKFSARAAALESEIRARNAAGEQVPWSIRGGATWGDTFWEWSARWPAAKLSFTDRYITLSVPSLTSKGEFRLERGEVLGIRELRGWFVRGFEILHEKAGVPRALLFRIWKLSQTHEALVRAGWHIQ